MKHCGYSVSTATTHHRFALRVKTVGSHGGLSFLVHRSIAKAVDSQRT